MADITRIEAELLSLFQREREAFSNRCRLRELEIERKAALVRQEQISLADFASLQKSFKTHMRQLQSALQALVAIIESDAKIRSTDPGIEELAKLRMQNKQLETEITELRKRHAQTVTDFRSFASLLNDSSNN